MKLYDILLANTDIKNFCAHEKYYYLKLLKQIVSLVNDKDVYQYQVEFQNNYTNITITDKALETNTYTITKDSSREYETRRIESKKGANLIRIVRYYGGSSNTTAHIDLKDNLIEDIIIDEDSIFKDADISISTYNNECKIRTREGHILSNSSIKLLNDHNKVTYIDEINTFLYTIAEEDKKIKVLK